MFRTVPTTRARAVLERLVQLNRISGELASKSEVEAYDEGGDEAGLALTPVRRRRLYEDVVQQLQSLVSSGGWSRGISCPRSVPSRISWL